MATLLDIAGRLGAEQTERAVLEFMPDIDELFAVLPFVASPSDVYSWYRTGNVPEAQPVDPKGTIPELDTQGTKESTYILAFVGHVDIYNFETLATASIVDRYTEKVKAATEAITRAFKKFFIQGTTHPELSTHVRGLKDYVTTDQTVDAGKNPLTFEMLDEVIAAVRPRPTALIMHPKAYVQFRKLMRSLNTTPEMVSVPNFGRQVPSYEGVIILQNEYVPVETDSDGNKLTTIFAVRLGENATAGIYMGDQGGVKITDIGELPDKDARRERISWYASMKVEEPWHVAAITNVKVG